MIFFIISVSALVGGDGGVGDGGDVGSAGTGWGVGVRGGGGDSMNSVFRVSFLRHVSGSFLSLWVLELLETVCPAGGV